MKKYYKKLIVFFLLHIGITIFFTVLVPIAMSFGQSTLKRIILLFIHNPIKYTGFEFAFWFIPLLGNALCWTGIFFLILYPIDSLRKRKNVL